jgi:hypothetical protein
LVNSHVIVIYFLKVVSFVEIAVRILSSLMQCDACCVEWLYLQMKCLALLASSCLAEVTNTGLPFCPRQWSVSEADGQQKKSAAYGGIQTTPEALNTSRSQILNLVRSEKSG